MYGLYSSGSTSYDKQRWRVVEASQYVELNSNTVFEDMSLDLNDVKSPNIDKKPSNASWATISDFYYQTSSSKVEINNTSIVGKETGSASITAVHKVTGRSYNFNVTVYKGNIEIAIFSSKFGVENVASVSIAGHGWIRIYNNTCQSIEIGAYTLDTWETMTIGRWKSQINDDDGDFEGLWYNREFYERKVNLKYQENIYFNVEVSKSKISDINTYINNTYNGYSLHGNNCVDFAVGFWNTIAPSQYNISLIGIAGFNTPSELADYIEDNFNYLTNSNLNGYYIGDCGFYNGSIYIEHNF